MKKSLLKLISGICLAAMVMSSTLAFANKAYAADRDIEQVGVVSVDTAATTKEQAQDSLKPIEARIIENNSSIRNAESGIALQSYQSELEVYAELESRVKNALLQGQTRVDISDMNLLIGQYDFSYFYAYSPYFTEDMMVYPYYYVGGSKYVEVGIENAPSASEAKTYFSTVDEKLNFYKSLVKSSMSEEEKALIIHDYIVSHSEYDTTYSTYKAEGIFMRGVGVCQSYSFAYMYIMNALGIECHFVPSTEMGHAWNLIRIDGSYYHVDCTFDDPVTDRFGLASHRYFLLSDAAISQNGHSGGDTNGITCKSEKFANAYWRDVDSPIVLVDGNAYYIYYGQLMKNALSSGSISTLVSFENAWNFDYYGLALDGSNLFYNTESAICAYSLTDGTNHVVIPISDIGTEGAFFNGCRIDGNKLLFAVASYSSDMEDIYSKELNITGWRMGTDGIWRYYTDGVAARNTWLELNGEWYHFNADGGLDTNKWIGSYYVKSDGSMAKSEWVDGGKYYVDANGVWDKTKQPAKWIKDGSKWWYRHSDGSYTRNNWEYINGEWYHFDNSGYMETNKWIGNYYVKADGTMAKSEWVDGNKYYVDANGVWDKTKQPAKWIKDGSKWWYRHSDGSYTRNNWEYINGAWYYFDNSGYMQTSKWIGNYYVKADGTMAKSEWVDGGKYYVDANGVWDKTKKPAQAQWIKEGSKWWYRHADGSYTRNGWEQIGGAWYHFDKNGYMEVSKWIGDYYVGSDGKMATNCWIGKYYVGPDGKWQR